MGKLIFLLIAVEAAVVAVSWFPPGFMLRFWQRNYSTRQARTNVIFGGAVTVAMTALWLSFPVARSQVWSIVPLFVAMNLASVGQWHALRSATH